MATRKRFPKAPAQAKAKDGRPARVKAARPAEPRAYTSDAWERVYLLSVQLEALARDLGLHRRERDPDGFDLADAASELARLAANHDRAVNPDGRTRAQEKDDWISLAGVGADVGNMAGEAAYAAVAGGVRAVAFELCYLACNYLF
jgi:hypothetical protein